MIYIEKLPKSFHWWLFTNSNTFRRVVNSLSEFATCKLVANWFSIGSGDEQDNDVPVTFSVFLDIRVEKLPASPFLQMNHDAS